MTLRPQAAADHRLYRELFDQAPIGILRTEPDGRIVFANPALARMLGYRDLEHFQAEAGSNVTALYQEAAQRQAALKRLTSTGGPQHFDTSWRRRDGSFLPCRLHVRASRTASGEVNYFEGFVEDITETRWIEEALKASGERYRSVFENTGTGTIIIEEDTTISLANDSFARMTGFTKEDIEGKMQWPMFIARSDDLQRMLAYHRQRREKNNRAPIEYEFTLIDRHGEYREVFLRVDMIAGSTSSIASLLDVSSHKDTKRSLLASSSRLSGILEAFDGYVYICDKEQQLLYLNRQLEHALGAGDDSLPCHKRIFDLPEPCSWCPKEQVYAGRTVKYEYLNPKDQRWYYAVSSPVFLVENQVGQMQTVSLDIHERKAAELAMSEREEVLRRENLNLRSQVRVSDRYRFGSLIGKSEAMQKVYRLIMRAAATDAHVIIYGESGTGKELVARSIHDLSERAKELFLPVNCGAIPSHLMESEFFGYKRGAFTGAQRDKQGLLARADGGTIFLDELGEITEAMQVKLLRFLEGYGYTPLGCHQIVRPEVRIIAATNRNLREMLDSGTMREDFFYRIHIIPIHLPPLRERMEDLPLLVEHFSEKHAANTGRPMQGRDLDLLRHHHWPGNVRELENTLQRYHDLGVLEFAGRSPSLEMARQPAPQAVDGPQLREAVQGFERQFILRQLEANRWNRSLTAKSLGIRRKTLYLKMKQLQID